MAIKIGADRWEGYALMGSALMNLKRYEDAADALSKAIERAPDSKQPSLRDLRRRCLLAESGYPAAPNSSASDSTHPAKAQLEDDRQHVVAKLTWTDPATGLMWARYSGPCRVCSRELHAGDALLQRAALTGVHRLAPTDHG